MTEPEIDVISIIEQIGLLSLAIKNNGGEDKKEAHEALGNLFTLVSGDIDMKDLLWEIKENLIEGESSSGDDQSEDLNLSGKNAQLWRFLLARKGKIVNHEFLRKELWPNLDDKNQRLSEKVGIYKIRKSLNSLGSNFHIVNIRGVGYKLLEKKT